MKENKRVLITGAAGFIGKYVTRELREHGIDYTAADHRGDNVQIVDLLNRQAMTELIARVQPDIVVHLAAIALVTHKNVEEIYNVNVCGTENLLEAIRSAGKKDTRVILVSTAGVYGNQVADFYDETLPFRPVNHYSYSKMVMEMLADLYRKEMVIKIIRPFNIIGTGQSISFFIPKLIDAFARKTPVLSLGNISSERDYVEVSFIAQVIKEMIMRETIPHEIYNICTGIAHTGHDVINTLKAITGFEPQVDITSELTRANEVWRLVGDPARIQSFMADSICKNPRSLEDILRSMLDDYATAHRG